MNAERAAAPTMTSSWRLLGRSASLVKNNLEAVIILALLPALALQLGSFLLPHNLTLGILVYLAAGIWLLVNIPVSYYYEVAICRGKHLTVGDAYSKGLRFFWPMIGLSLMAGFLIMGGLVLLIVPGLIMLRRYVLAPYYLIEHSLSINAAMKQSAADSKPAAGYIWGALGVTMTVSILASLASLPLLLIPGLSGVVSSCLSVILIFVFPLRYIEVARQASREPAKA